jgi:hypothetical protein
MRYITKIVRSARWPTALPAAAALALAAWVAPATAQQNKQQQDTQQQDKQAGDKGGSFSIQPETITFGRTPLFFKRTDAFTVRNHGQAPIRNLKVELEGYNEQVFSLDNQCGETLAPNQQCEVRVSFEPKSEGNKTTQVRLTAGAESVRTRAVSGQGVAAKYTATPKSLSFGRVANGTASQEQVVTITNTGDVALPITATSLGGQNEKQFAHSNDCPRELAAGKSCRSTVKFRPTWNGEHQATLTVWAKGGAPETKIALSGTGTGGSDDQSQKNEQAQKTSSR